MRSDDDSSVMRGRPTGDPRVPRSLGSSDGTFVDTPAAETGGAPPNDVVQGPGFRRAEDQGLTVAVAHTRSHEEAARTPRDRLPASVRASARNPLAANPPRIASVAPDAYVTPSVRQPRVGAGSSVVATLPKPAIASPPVSAHPPSKVDPASTLFRDEALRAYESDQAIASALRIESVGAWVGFLLLAAFVTLALTVATAGSVNLTAHARGGLRTIQGTVMASAAVDGTLRKVFVRVGQVVNAGDLLAEVDGKTVHAELMRANRAVEAFQARAKAEQNTLAPLRRDTLELLHRRAHLARRRAKSQRGDETRLQRRRKIYRGLTASGAAATADIEGVEDRLSSAYRTRLADLDQANELESQLTALKLLEANRIAAHAQELAQVLAQQAAAELLAQQVFVKAPRGGRIESLLVNEGDRVQPGTQIAQIVPTDAPLLAVVFVHERDRAFLEAGRPAHVELDRLPRSEFGTLPAMVSRVAKEIAPVSEVVRYLGEDGLRGTYVRVDLTLLETKLPDSVRRHLESGAKLTARVPLRERRFLSLVFEPVRRWLD